MKEGVLMYLDVQRLMGPFCNSRAQSFTKLISLAMNGRCQFLYWKIPTTVVSPPLDCFQLQLLDWT